MGSAKRLTERVAPKFTQTLVIGAIVSLVLLVVIFLRGAVEIRRIQQMTLALAEHSERSSFLAGDVGEELARLNAGVASAIHSSPEALGPLETRIAAIRKSLKDSARDLPDALQPALRPHWDAIRPEVERLEGNLAAAFDLARAGERARAAELLDRDVDAAARLHESLSGLDRANEDELLAALQSARLSVERVRLLQLLFGGLLFLGTIAIWIAVTRIVRKQARLLGEYADRLEYANEDLDAFAGRVAHDLKNALSPLVITAQMIQRPAAADPAKFQALAGRIEHSSRKAVGIVEGLLAFSRAGKPSETEEAASLREVLREVLEELDPLFSQVGVAVETAVEDVRVRCPATLLHVVLANLGNNAAKFMDGQPVRRVRISARPEGSWCVIDVEDTGPGIPADCLERIFEPFYRVPGTRAPGIGIGLATVRRIVTAYGGSVAADSVEGRGSRLEVRLPLGPAAPPRDQLP